jgi:hypothetical protein
MRFKLKALGLAIVAALATTVVTSALTAQASETAKVTAAEYPAVLHATGANTEVFTAFGGETTCGTSTFTSTLSEAKSTIEVTPEYTNCKGHGLFGSEIPATVTMNGCKYTFHNPKTDQTPEPTKTHASGEITHFYKITTTIHCPLNKAIEVHLYSSHNAHTSGTSFCTITITGETNGKNQNLEGLTVDVTTKTPTNPNDLQLTGTVSNIHAEFHRNSFLCPHEGTTPTTENGQYHLPATGVTVTATKEGVAKSVDIG